MSPKTQIESASNDSDELNFLEYWRVVRKHTKLISCLFIICVISTAVISLLMTPIYQAKTTLMAIESPQGRISSALGALQNIPFVGGAVGGALGKTVTDRFVNILNSRTIAEDVIHELNLTKELFKENWDPEKGKWKSEKAPTLQDTLQLLQKGLVKIVDDRKGLISIAVEYENPNLAAQIANEYPAAFHRFLKVNAVSLAKRNRIFLEKQLVATKVDLEAAEEQLKSYQTKKKVVALDAQAEGSVKALADLKAQIIIREIQLGAMREFATQENPDVKRIKDEIREIQFQLKRLEDGTKQANSDGSLGTILTLNEAPTIGLAYGRLKRDALIQQKIFELLIQQYELAKLEEAKDDLTFQVIDKAIPPEKRIKPRRTLNVLMAAVASLVFGCFLSFFQEYLEKQRSTKFGLALKRSS